MFSSLLPDGSEHTFRTSMFDVRLPYSPPYVTIRPSGSSITSGSPCSNVS